MTNRSSQARSDTARQGALAINMPTASARKTRLAVVKVAVGEGVQPMSFRPPLDLHTELRIRSLEIGQSMQRIIETALREHFKNTPRK